MKIANKTLNYVKSLTAQSINMAGSGNTGSSLGASAIMLALFKEHYVFDVSDTDFLNRDRLIISSAHTAPLYYTLLSLFGFDVSLNDLKNLRKLKSKTPAFPTYQWTDGVETSTGMNGQGVANAVGMAISQNMLAEKFNSIGFPIIDHYVYCLVGDGDLMEGSCQEACSLAGTLHLSKLILLYDSNDVTSDGNINASNRENVARKFKAMGWNVVVCQKGNDYHACVKAIAKAKQSSAPTIVIFKTTIGIGTSKEGTSSVHKTVLTNEELKRFNKSLGVFENFYVPNDVRDWCMATTRQGKLVHEKWNQDLAVYATSNPVLYREFNSFFDKKKIDIEKMARNSYKYEGLSGRELNHIILNEIAQKLTQFVGGNSDTMHSTKCTLDNVGFFSTANKRGRNIQFGNREKSMAGICNGIALYEDFYPFASTLLAYASYMLPEIRLSAMMKLNTLYLFTHDSIAVGEAGVTVQPIEQIANLRSIIGLNVFRPCDGNEMLAGYAKYINDRGPMAMVLSKQPMDVVDGKFEDALRGGYIIRPAKNQADVVLFATGSEVGLAFKVAEELNKKQLDVSVVSMPCLELFENQTKNYQESVLQKNAKLAVAIEASNDAIWYKYVGCNGLVVGVENYQLCGKGADVYANAGFDSKEIARKILRKLEK